ncbi:MAG: DUF4199 domain-containing protein [Ferruginibacter sp.]
MKTLSAKSIGLITGGLMVGVFLLLFYSFHFPERGTIIYVCYSIYIAGIIFSLVSFKNYGIGEKTFKDYFSQGFKTFVIVVLMMAVFAFIFYKMNPQILENTLAEINKVNSTDTNKTAGEVTENANRIRNIFIPMTVAINTVMYLIMGALVSVIGAGLLSQKRNAF